MDAFVNNLGLYRRRLNGSKEAVYDYDKQQRYTFDEMDARAERLGRFLVGELGLKKGDRIAFCSENTVAFLDAFLMSYKTGIIITTYNCMLSKMDLHHLVARESPRALFYSANRADAVEEFRSDDITFVAIVGEKDERDPYTYDEIMAYQPESEVTFEPPEMEDIQMLIHTGGTTGEPKAAMMSYRALFYNAIGEILTWDLTSRDSAYVFLPLFHTAAWNVLLLPVLMAGGRVILTAGFRPDAAVDIIKKERPSVCMGIETLYKMLTRHPEFDTLDLSCYRFMISGAAPISRATMEAYWAKGVMLVNAYGMTEIGPNNLSPAVNYVSREEIREKWNTAGKPMMFNNMRIVDSNGNDVPPGGEGELIFSGLLTFSGYWKDEARTAEIVRDGWVYTGDVARQDEEGYVTLCGRKKNLYISGGENIYPIEIENAICAHPAVESCCIIGVPDDKWGEVGKALVVLKPGELAGKEEIQKAVSAVCSSIKVPKYVQIVPEIPKNSVGKLDLTKTRQLYAFSADG